MFRDALFVPFRFRPSVRLLVGRRRTSARSRPISARERPISAPKSSSVAACRAASASSARAAASPPPPPAASASLRLRLLTCTAHIRHPLREKGITIYREKQQAHSHKYKSGTIK
eukprot:1190386-Prorocentrum_minimum.AAC.4